MLRSHGFFFNDTATTEICTLSLHDALPICASRAPLSHGRSRRRRARGLIRETAGATLLELRGSSASDRSEEHTSELQSRQYLVCRLLLEKITTLSSYLRPRRAPRSYFLSTP